MKPIYPLAQAEMLAQVFGARVVAEFFNIEDLMRLAATTAEFAARFPTRPAGLKYPASEEQIVDHAAELAVLLAARASRLIPGAECLHRALAGRVWLARRGVDAQIVVGFRKRGVIQGHAWLEIATPGGSRCLFKSADDGYRESFREKIA